MINESRTSNALGVPIPQWIIRQLEKRSEQLQVQNENTGKPNDNILFRANRSAWIRMVSSVDIIKDNAKQYFRDMGLEITDPSSFSKSFVLQGGVSKYSNNNGPFSYGLRDGFSEAYNVAGNSETKNYGYRPMPGIQSVKVQTQGKLGSIKAAEIQIKVWDKAQLDIIDALYFKLGYTMFLEWGHTNYYDSDTGQLISTEDYSIDPFEKGLTKEDIYNKISNNIRKLQGNYDAMLGVVTNFNFTYNQEGGYDCTLKMISLGVLISNMKMNNPRVLPDLQEEVVKRLVNTLTQLEKQRIAREQAAAAAANPPAPKTDTIPPLKVEELISQYLKYDSTSKIYTGARIVYNSASPQNIKYADIEILNTAYGDIFIIRKLKGFIPLRSDLLPQVKFKFNGDAFYNLLREVKLDLANQTFESDIDVFKSIFSPSEVWNRIKNIFSDGPDSDSKKNNSYRELTLSYPSTNKLSYQIKIRAKTFATTTDTTVTNLYYPIDTAAFLSQMESVLKNKSNEYNIESLDIEDIIAQPGESSKDKVNIKFNFTIPFTRNVQAKAPDTVDPVTLQPIEGKIIQKDVLFRLFVSLEIQDTRFIESFTTPSSVIQPIEFLGNGNAANQNAAGAAAAPPPEPPAPTLQVSDVQKTETEKYRSAFEVIIRLLQLYSLDQSISQGIEKDHVVKELKLLDKKVFSEFTKKLFDSGLFSSMLNDLTALSKEASTKDPSGYIVDRCLAYDENIRTGTFADKEEMMLIRALFGFHFGLLGNTATASYLLKGNLAVDYDYLMRTYTVPYEFNQGIFQGSQLNHPVYIPLGLVIMVLNHMCTMYDDNKPIVYLDFNHKSNLCLSNAKHLPTNPYDVLIPFQGTNEDFLSILEPSTVVIREESDSKTKKVISSKLVIKAISGSSETPPVYTPINESTSTDAIRDRISGGLMLLKQEKVYKSLIEEEQ